MMSDDKLILDSVARIEHIEIPLPKGGGIVVFEGRNGTCKSEALNAVQALLGKGGEIKTQDGAPAGEVSIQRDGGQFVTVRMARRLSRSGKLEIDSLEGKFDVGTLVLPGIKDPEAADALRVKALIQLTDQSKPSPSLFYEICGGKENFEALVSTESASADDLVVMSSKVKRDLEKNARLKAEKAQRAKLSAETSRRAAEGVDVSLPCDAQVLQHELEQAIRASQALETQAAEQKKKQTEYQVSQTQLKLAQESYVGLTITNAIAKCTEALSDFNDSVDEVLLLQNKLDLAIAKRDKLELLKNAAGKALDEAKAHETQISTLSQIIASGEPELVPEESIALAAENVSKARQTLETGVQVRTAKQQLLEAGIADEQFRIFEQEAESLRNSAQATDTVLSAAVERLNSPLRVRNGRLVLKTERSDHELFEDLSLGQRTRVVVDIAIEALGIGGLLVVPQELWDGLDKINRDTINEQVSGTGVVILTAKVGDGEEISASVYEA
jgi:hypothetical protein